MDRKRIKRQMQSSGMLSDPRDAELATLRAALAKAEGSIEMFKEQVDHLRGEVFRVEAERDEAHRLIVAYAEFHSDPRHVSSLFEPEATLLDLGRELAKRGQP